MAEAIKLFCKLLTDTDTRKRLAVPAKILPALPDFNGSYAVKLHLMYGTKAWPIVCSVRKNGVGDKLTLYKVHDIDEAGSSYYKVEVEKPAKPSGDISLNHPVDNGTTGSGTYPTKVPNFECEKKLLFKDADAPIKEEGAPFMEPAYDAAPVPFASHVVSKPPCRVFGIDLSEEGSREAQFKTEMKSSGITMCLGGEPPLHSSYYMIKEEKEINFIGPAYGIGTSEACCRSGTQRHSLNLAPHAEEMNLDLTLAPMSIVETMVGC
ncbi:Replicase polyprotein 1ab [Gossypium australe]|uniref:Replicase polyprotein 1ab n=1 Tax=Gossypium australe TaxID=47621 RepID=A0A5B6V8C2_9ROSI|nr:Replicase polyprotein 1ab [Gossypium australe]